MSTLSEVGYVVYDMYMWCMICICTCHVRPYCPYKASLYVQITQGVGVLHNTVVWLYVFSMCHCMWSMTVSLTSLKR